MERTYHVEEDGVCVEGGLSRGRHGERVVLAIDEVERVWSCCGRNVVQTPYKKRLLIYAHSDIVVSPLQVDIRPKRSLVD